MVHQSLININHSHPKTNNYPYTPQAPPSTNFPLRHQSIPPHTPPHTHTHSYPNISSLDIQALTYPNTSPHTRRLPTLIQTFPPQRPYTHASPIYSPTHPNSSPTYFHTHTHTHPPRSHPTHLLHHIRPPTHSYITSLTKPPAHVLYDFKHTKTPPPHTPSQLSQTHIPLLHISPHTYV